MNTTAAPTPWRIEGSTVVDAMGRIVVVLAGRLSPHREILATIAAAPEMLELLRALEKHLTVADQTINAALPENRLLLDDVRAMLEREVIRE